MRSLSLPATLGRALTIFVFCIVAAFVCAFAFVLLLQRSLPPSDSAYGLPLSRVFSNPFVSGGAVEGAIVFGVTSVPFMYIALPQRRFLKGAFIVFVVVLSEILLVTPFFGWLGLFGSLPAFGLAWAYVWDKSVTSSRAGL
jgi:hypothetical protein